MIQQLVASMRTGDRRALARLLTLVEQDGPEVGEVMRAAHPYTGHAYTIGITGPPGAGKSTVVDGLLRLLRRDGFRLGVLAADPTSPFSGGAVLGDRVRMQDHFLDPEVFIRSMATRGSHGGLSRVTMRAVRVMDAAARDYVVLETVGVGQTELDVVGMADTVVVVLVPEAGDAVQTMKAGLMEIADIFVVNKADRPGARQLETALRAMLTLDPRHRERRIQVLLTQATTGEGLEELYAAILQHRQEQERTTRLAERRRERRRREFFQAVGGWVEDKLWELTGDAEELGQVMSGVEAGERDPYLTALEVLSDHQLLRTWLTSLDQG